MTETIYRPVAPLWQVGARCPEKESVLQKELGISPLTAAVLVQRGFCDPAAALAFLNPSLDELGAPSLLPDYRKAVDAILGARERKDLIFIHGDYDVDGVTSAAILHRFLTKIGCVVHTHVPHRIREGYGIHLDAVERAHELGAKLFLTCDCGIAAHEQVKQASALGMVVVVTDHHEIADSIPEAEAVINPHRKDSLYPERELSGAGVVFRLCEGISSELGHPVNGYRRAFLDLACLGTIADVMPLLGENRIIAKFGLERLNCTQKVGLQALMREANVGVEWGKPIQAFTVGWQLGPRLNAVGRIEDAANALKLLIEYDESAASLLAAQLEAVNKERRERTAAIVDQAVEMVLENGYHESSMIVVGHTQWHPGIVGIVAGRLVEKFCRPCLVLNIDEKAGTCKGSARSISNFHLAEAIWAFPALVKGGGHAMAAGCSFLLVDLDEVRRLFNDFAKSRIDPEDLIPKIYADLEISPAELNLQAADELLSLQPFGCGNPEPLFMARSAKFTHITPTKNPAHVRVRIAHGIDRPVSGIAFHLGESLCQDHVNSPVDLLFKPEANEYRGERSLQWQIRHFRASD